MSRGKYQYRAHGLTIESELELPEFAPFDGLPDVRICVGAVADQLEGSVSHGPGYQAAEGRFLLNVRGTARYLVTSGTDVRVAPAPGATESDVRLFLLSSVVAAVAHQRGLLALHAGAVDVDGGAVLFAGDSGTGKSTLTAAFHDRGYPIITDDVSVVAFDHDGHPMIHPGHRHVRLSAHALEHVGASLGAGGPLTGRKQKHRLTIPGPRPATPFRIRKMFLLSGRPAESITLRPLGGPAKVTGVVRGTYRRRMSVALGRRAAHFAQCVTVAQRIEITTVDRPRSLDGLQDLVDALENDLRAR